MKKISNIKIAIVHDWLVTYAGAERVLSEIISLFPHADIFSVVDFLSEADRQRIGGKVAKTTFVQKLPAAKKRYRSYLPIMPFAIEQIDLSGYDLVISSSHAVAKGILTGPNQTHISYVHSPIRYAWDMQHQYLREARLERGLKSYFARGILHYLRLWDSRTANGVDQFVANSQFIRRRIRKVYGREAKVIYPPVNIKCFNMEEEKDDYYFTASRLVPYKRVDLIAKAFAKMPEKRLIIVGDGPDEKKVRAAAGPNIEFLGYQSDVKLRQLMAKARAFVFAAEEDFGILPVEAQACGTPVIAYGKGGALETVVDSLNANEATGILFCEQSDSAIRSAVARFESLPASISARVCRANAERFSTQRFRDDFMAIVMNNIPEISD